MKKIRWGMIGTGAVTEKKSAPGLYKAENSELIGVYGIDREQVLDYVKRHKIKKVYESAEELVESIEIDAVYIATPPSAHKEYIIKAIMSGKSVYVEKPLATNYEECIEIYNLAKEKNVKVFTAFYRRGMEKFNKIKKLLEEKSIGEIRYVDVVLQQSIESSGYTKEKTPWRFKGEISGGGIFLDMGIHTIDILEYLIGEIEDVKSIASNQAGLYDVEDIVTAVWSFKSGIQGIGKWCFTAFENMDKIEIVGDRGKIKFSCFDDTSIQLIRENQIEEFKYENPEHVQQPYIQEIVNELLGGKKHSGSLESSIKSQKISEEILKHYKITKKYK